MCVGLVSFTFGHCQWCVVGVVCVIEESNVVGILCRTVSNRSSDQRPGGCDHVCCNCRCKRAQVGALSNRAVDNIPIRRRQRRQQRGEGALVSKFLSIGRSPSSLASLPTALHPQSTLLGSFLLLAVKISAIQSETRRPDLVENYDT